MMSSPKRVCSALTSIVLVAVLAIAPAGRIPPAWPAGREIVIRPTAVEPHGLRAIAGQRVNFITRVDRPGHLEFVEDPKQQHVFQVPAVGHIWAVLHPPGTHPDVVHVYSRKTIVLRGLVEVAEDPHRPFGPGTCGAMIMEECIEP